MTELRSQALEALLCIDAGSHEMLAEQSQVLCVVAYSPTINVEFAVCGDREIRAFADVESWNIMMQHVTSGLPSD